MAFTTNRRRRHRWAALVGGGVLVLAGCTTTTLSPTTALSPVSGTTTAGAPASDPPSSVSSDGAGSPSASPPGTSDTGTSSSGATSAESPSGAEASVGTPTSPSAPAVYSPPPDAEATEGDCPYLSKDQVQADTGQRMGTTRIRPATPAPICEFVRSDGGFLATVRVLQLDSDSAAVAAVDFYVPRETSNPETRPTGWTGGSLATDDGSTYGVSKGGYAVIALTNQKQSVYARLLVVHAIESLGL